MLSTSNYINTDKPQIKYILVNTIMHTSIFTIFESVKGLNLNMEYRFNLPKMY